MIDVRWSVPVRRVSIGVLVILSLAVSSRAQVGNAQSSPSSPRLTSEVRVTADQAIIWGPGFTTIVAVVHAGTILPVVARMDRWYEVVVPGRERTSRETGFLLVAQVELVPGSQQLPEAQATLRTTPGRASSTPLGVWGFGQVGYARFDAHQSFNAVLGTPWGAFVGGGVEVRARNGLFVAATAEFFRKTGEQVFVANREVFKLGIPNTITIVPVYGTLGWRFGTRRAVPYVGGGAGAYVYREHAAFAEAGDDIHSAFASYHLVGGVEFRFPHLATAFEVQYTFVPNALGVAGASSAFDEHDLGGVEARTRILVGPR